MSTNYRNVWAYVPQSGEWRKMAERLTVAHAERLVSQAHTSNVEAGNHGAAVVALSLSRQPEGDPATIEGARIVPSPALEPEPAGPDLSPFTAPEFHPASPDAAVEPDLFRTVAYADAAFEAARTELVAAVAAARTAGATWTGIGATLGITRQGASQRFKSSVDELTAVVLEVAGDEIERGA